MRHHTTAALVAAALIALAACSDDASDTGAADAADAADAATDTEVADTAATSPDTEATSPDTEIVDTTPDVPSDPIDEERLMTHDGVERLWRLYVPESVDRASPAPVVFNFHGATPPLGTNTASLLQAELTLMKDKAAAEGFIVVHPQGLSNANGRQTWNAAEACCSDDLTRDDEGFVLAILAALRDEFLIDDRRIYATGISNGGFMSFALACHHADVFAAIAPVAALNGTTPCDPSRPVPALVINGTDDELVNYDLAAATVAVWASLNGCDATTSSSFQNGDSACDAWSGCDAAVEFCTVTGGGHTWPGGIDVFEVFGYGYTTMDLSATDAMWDFFLAHPLP